MWTRQEACRQPAPASIQGGAQVPVREAAGPVGSEGLPPCVHVCNGCAGTWLTCACNPVLMGSVRGGTSCSAPAPRGLGNAAAPPADRAPGHKEAARLDARSRPSAGPRPEAPPGPPICPKPRPSTRPAHLPQAPPHRFRSSTRPPICPGPAPWTPPTSPPPRGPAPPFHQARPSDPGPAPPGRGPAPPPAAPPRPLGVHPGRQASGTLTLWFSREAGGLVSALGSSLQWAQTHTGRTISALNASYHLTGEQTGWRQEGWALSPAAWVHSVHSARTGKSRWVCYLVIKLFTAVNRCDPRTALH